MCCNIYLQVTSWVMARCHLTTAAPLSLHPSLPPLLQPPFLPKDQPVTHNTPHPHLLPLSLILRQSTLDLVARLTQRDRLVVWGFTLGALCLQAPVLLLMPNSVSSPLHPLCRSLLPVEASHFTALGNL